MTAVQEGLFPAPIEAPLTPGERHPIQPTLDGRVNGVIAEWHDEHPAGGSRLRFAFQCQGCGLVEHPWPITNMAIHFNPRHEDGKRRCKECRIVRAEANFPDCKCAGCTVDKTGSYYR